MLDAASVARIDRHEVVPPPLDVDTARERFLVEVPPAMPAKGYGLFVYVSPFEQPDLPPGWAEAVARRGMIAVSAANSGNGRGAFVRRAPLALIGAQSAMAKYRIDPGRVIIAGFSGGSRVALKLALAYPDVFTAALLDAGSDVIGTPDLPTPSPDLLTLATNHRFALLSGANDSAKLMNVYAAIALRGHGLTQIYVREIEYLEHDAAPVSDVRNALAFLDRPAKSAPPPTKKVGRRGKDQALLACIADWMKRNTSTSKPGSAPP